MEEQSFAQSMKTTKNKIYSCFHTRSRLLQRHHISMSLEEYDLLCQKFIDQVYNNKFRGITIITREESNNQIIFKANFKDKLIKFVWCGNRKLITTVLK